MLEIRFTVDVDPRTVAMGVLSTLVGLAGERFGRCYGRGVLKLEPGDWRRLSIPIAPAAGGAFSEADRLIRAGREAEARRLADRVVLQEGLGLGSREVALLRKEVKRLADWRRPLREQP